MIATKLDPSVLYIFVCGPGQGESTVIHVPPGEWIVIDSCRSAKQVFASHILQHYGGPTACLVLTHRHKDHYRGISAVAQDYDWTNLGCCDRTLTDPDTTEDGEEKLANELGQFFATVRRQWNSKPSTEWKTWRGTQQSVGEAMLISLHPEYEFAKSFVVKHSEDENKLSSAMMLRWRDYLFLLGADTPIPFWTEIQAHFKDDFVLAEHLVAKIPHHGSLASLEPMVLTNKREQFWVVTPFNTSEGLPKFDSGEGLDFLLQRNAEVHLTGLPVAQSEQPASPCRTTLAKLQADEHPSPIPFTLPGRVGIDVTPTTSDGPKNYYVIAIDAGGKLDVMHSENGTVVVENVDRSSLGVV